MVTRVISGLFDSYSDAARGNGEGQNLRGGQQGNGHRQPWQTD